MIFENDFVSVVFTGGGFSVGLLNVGVVRFGLESGGSSVVVSE